MRNHSADEIVKIQDHLRKQVMVLITHPTAPNLSLAKTIMREIYKLDSDLSKLRLEEAINQTTI